MKMDAQVVIKKEQAKNLVIIRNTLKSVDWK